MNNKLHQKEMRNARMVVALKGLVPIILTVLGVICLVADYSVVGSALTSAAGYLLIMYPNRSLEFWGMQNSHPNRQFIRFIGCAILLALVASILRH